MSIVKTNGLGQRRTYRRLWLSSMFVIWFFPTVTSGQTSIGGNTMALVSGCESGHLCFAIDAAQQSPISPYIFGSNDAPEPEDRRFSFYRFGGNRLTAYNWENNASNAGEDWFNQSDGYLGGGDVPGEATRSLIEKAHDNDAGALVTIPIQGFVAADKNGGGDVGNTPDYLNTRFHESVAKKEIAFNLSPNLYDGVVYQDEFVHFLEHKFPEAHSGGSPEVFYSLDNEPALWNSTHPRIQLNPVTYQELISKTLAFSEAIKDVTSDAIIFGPVSYGWGGFDTLQWASDANDRNFLETYLEAVRLRSEELGVRLVDVVDIHWYSEAQGSGIRVLENSSLNAVLEARMQAPRSLWDSSYEEVSWITEWMTAGPIQLIPYLRDIIEDNYPGTKLAFTEYNHGGGDRISGGIAQADTLGIFAREGVFAASYWALGDESFTYAAFDMYRNFDSTERMFGNTAVAADTSDLDESSVYGSLDDEGRMILVVINKSSATKPANFQITNGQAYQTAEYFHLTGASAVAQIGATQNLNGASQFSATLPAKSVTTIVLSGVGSEPPPPDEDPGPTQPKVLFDGETEMFSAGWALNNGRIRQSSRNPYSAPRHIRAKMPVINWWGGSGYAFYGWGSGDWSGYSALRMRARVSHPVDVMFNVADDDQNASQNIVFGLTQNYQEIEIPLGGLSGIDITRIVQLQLGISEAGTRTYRVDLDDITLIP